MAMTDPTDGDGTAIAGQAGGWLASQALRDAPALLDRHDEVWR